MDATKLLSVKRKAVINTKSNPRNILTSTLKILVLASPLLLLTHLFHQGHEGHHPKSLEKGFLAPNVNPDMLTSGFWISRTPDADQLVLSPEEIKAWNMLEAGEKNSVIFDLVEFDRFKTGKEVEDALQKDASEISGKKLYTRNRISVSAEDLKLLEASQNRKEIGGNIPLRYGILIRDSNIRIFPTYESLTEEPGDLEFDELQNSRAKAFTCLLILHTSADKGWFYVQMADVHGWVPVDDVALVPDKRAAKSLTEPDDFLMVIGDTATVFSDPACTLPLTQIRMGTRVSLISDANSRENTYSVMIPIKGSGGLVDLTMAYVKKSDDAHIGYFPLTRKNILIQAFKLLGQPYGWGGLWKARDCSSYIQDVFSTMGVILPRNSKNQAESGSYFVQFSEKTPDSEKEAALNQAPPVTSLLRLNGHIMIYLGKVGDHYYVIHNSSGYRKPGLFKDQTTKLNQVVVTDLSLGKGSKKKSLIERLISINTIA